MKFKYLILGNHPIFQYINRYCITYKEVKNIKKGLEAIGYEIEVQTIKPAKSIKIKNIIDEMG